jgi:hypothetical protein
MENHNKKGNPMNDNYQYNDGGRAEAGFKGTAGDCGVRSIAIAMQRPYKEVYDEMNNFLMHKRYSPKMRGTSTSRGGIHKKFFGEYMKERGWKWVATMGIGKGCKTHLEKDELPPGRIICNVSRHYVAVIDGVVNDTFDCRRMTTTNKPKSTRCVYGFWTK